MVKQREKCFLHNLLTVLDGQRIESQDIAQEAVAEPVKQSENFGL